MPLVTKLVSDLVHDGLTSFTLCLTPYAFGYEVGLRFCSRWFDVVNDMRLVTKLVSDSDYGTIAQLWLLTFGYGTTVQLFTGDGRRFEPRA